MTKNISNFIFLKYYSKVFTGLVVWVFLLQLGSAQTMRNLFFNSNSNVVRLDFATDPPIPYATGVAGSYEGIAHYEDGSGNLLFWFNSNGIFNQNGTFMSGSFGIFANSSSAEINICPVPGSPNRYYILYNAETCSNLYYSIVDMTLNGGLGNVVSLNTLISSSNFSEGMEVVQIPGTSNYWFLTYQCGVGFTKFLISPSGIGPAQVFHPYPMPAGGYDGRCEFDYHRGRIGIGFAWSSQVFLADFDPVEGEVCNPVTLSSPEFNNNPFGVDFSPTANKMYFSLWYTTGVPNVFQYDFTSGTYTGYQPPLGGSGWISGLGQIELGRDGKLYIIEDGGSNIIVINNPDDDVPVFSLIPIPSTTGLGISDQIQTSEYNNSVFFADTICSFAGNFIPLTPSIANNYWFATTTNPTDTIGTGTSLGIIAQNTPVTYIAKPLVTNCFDNIQFSWTIAPTPLLSVSNNGPICFGEYVFLYCSPSPVSTYTYEWSGPYGFSSTLQNPIIIMANPGYYSVTVTNSVGCTSASGTYLQMEQTQASAWPNQTICTGETAIIYAEGGMFYNWSNGETTPAITVSPTVNTTYMVTVTSDSGCTASAAATVNVLPLPPANAGSNQTICWGQTIQLTATGGSTYQWSTTDTTAVILVTPAANTTYTVTVTNEMGCANSAQVTVFVTEGNFNVVGPYQTEPLITCYTDSTYTVSFSISGGMPPYLVNGITLQPDNSNIYTTSVLNTPNYLLEITDNTGCTTFIDGSAEICGFDCIVTATLESVPDYSGTCLNGFEISVLSAPPQPPVFLYSYDGINFQESPVFTNLQAGIYSPYILTGCGLQSLGTYYMPYNALSVDANISPNGNAGFVGVATVTGGTPPYNIIWSSGATGTTALFSDFVQPIYITVTDDAGCQNLTQLQPEAPVSAISGIFPNHISCLIYPNPANNFIAVQSETLSGRTEGNLAIVNSCGQEMYLLNGLVNFPIIIQTEKFPSGIYFLIFTTQQHTFSSKFQIIH